MDSRYSPGLQKDYRGKNKGCTEHDEYLHYIGVHHTAQPAGCGVKSRHGQD